MDQTQTPSEHPKLDALIAGYLEAVERGEAPDRGQIVAANPDLADQLRAFFDDLDHVQRAAASPHDGPALDKPDAAHASTVIRHNHEPTPGIIIAGRYKLLENIGEGGMGSVWVAEQLKPVKRKVAIKLIKPGMDSKQVLARFEAERQALAVMDHPNIAKVFDGGLTEQGRPYFVMEYVKGVPFTDYCDRARLSLKDRLSLFIAVCSAVQHAHQKGIVHRDLKPSNILICLYDGHPVPKVIDFGLAKAMHQPLTEQSIFTGHGVMVGTPLYMSPEQAESNNLDIDTRTDIYSLGVVLYELLTGSTPLERQQLQKAAFDEVLRLIKEVEPPRPSLRLSGSDSLASIAAQRSIDPKQLSRSLAGDLDWIVMKTLDKERSRRYETANGLARDIERFLNEEPVEACPPSTAYRFKKYIHRHRGQVIAAGVVLTTLLIGIIGTTWGLFQAEAANEKTQQALKEVTTERDAKEAERVKAATAREQAQEAAKQLSQQKSELETANTKSNALLAEAAQSNRLTARNLWRLGRPRDAIAHWARSQEYEPQSVFEISMIVFWTQGLAFQPSVATLRGHTNNVLTAVFSPDGTRIVTASWDQTARVWDVATGQSLSSFAIFAAEGLISRPSFSPDGTRLVAVSTDNNVKIWKVSTGESLATLTGHKNWVECVAFSPDGTRIVTASQDKTARVWDATTGLSLATLEGHENVVESATFSPDGARIVTVSFDKTARVWDAATGLSLTTLTTLSGQECERTSAAFSPDGMRIVTTFENMTAQVWDASTGQSLATLTGHESAVLSAEFSPDGTRIVTASEDNTARVWNALTGESLATLTAHESIVWSAEFSSDGTRVVTASQDGTARVWDASTGQSLATLAGHDSAVWSAEFSSDGSMIVTASLDETARVWNVSTGQFTSRIAASSLDEIARVWDEATGFTIREEVAPVYTNVIFDSDHMTYSDSGQPDITVTGGMGWVMSAEFSPDGTRAVTASLEKTARLSDFVTYSSPPPAWFTTCLRFLAHRALKSGGELTDWPPLEEQAQVVETLKKDISADNSSYGDFGRYFLTPGLDKPTYPGSRVTCGEAADQLISQAALQPEIKRAYNWHPTHPLIHIALAKFETEPKRAEFLREYGVSRLLKRQPSPEDSAPQLATLCHRAEALLLDQKDQVRADLVHKRSEELASKR